MQWKKQAQYLDRSPLTCTPVSGRQKTVRCLTSVGPLERPPSIGELNYPEFHRFEFFIVKPSKLRETQILKKGLRYYSQLQNRGVCHFIQCFYSKHLLISNCVPCAAGGMGTRVENILALMDFPVLQEANKRIIQPNTVWKNKMESAALGNIVRRCL